MSVVIGNGDDTLALRQVQNTFGPTSLFRLPPELRLMIWKLLLPERRILKARSSGASIDPRRTDDRRFVFCFDSKVSQPILSQICAESRQCLLDYGHGQFIFGLEGEAGFWWGPQDVLLFDQDWCLRWATPSLQGLNGLDCVKNIALDATQAQYIYYEYVLPEDDENSQDGSENGDQGDYNEGNNGDAKPASLEPQALQPQSITVGYMSCTDRPHFLEYFTALNKLMIVFEPTTLYPMGSTGHYAAPAEWGPISQFLDKPCCYGWVTFDRDSTNMADAIFEVSKLRRFWVHTSSLNYWSYCEYDNTFNEDHVLYDFCIDRSSTGLAYEPTRVTSFDMMNDGDWAL